MANSRKSKGQYCTSKFFRWLRQKKYLNDQCSHSRDEKNRNYKILKFKFFIELLCIKNYQLLSEITTDFLLLNIEKKYV